METRRVTIIITLLIFFFILVAQTAAKAAVRPQVAAGNNHIVGLRADGTVVALGFSGGAS